MSSVKMFPHCFNNIEVWTNPWLKVLHFLFWFFWPFTALVHSFAFIVTLKSEAVANQMLSGCYHMVDPNLSIHFCVHSSLLTRAQPLEPWQSPLCWAADPLRTSQEWFEIKKIIINVSVHHPVRPFVTFFQFSSWVILLTIFAYHFFFCLSVIVSLNCFVMFWFGFFKEHTVHCGEVCR